MIESLFFKQTIVCLTIEEVKSAPLTKDKPCLKISAGMRSASRKKYIFDGLVIAFEPVIIIIKIESAVQGRERMRTLSIRRLQPMEGRKDKI